MPKKLWYVIIDDTIEEHHPHHWRATPTLLRNNALDYSFKFTSSVDDFDVGKARSKINEVTHDEK